MLNLSCSSIQSTSESMRLESNVAILRCPLGKLYRELLPAPVMPSRRSVIAALPMVIAGCTVFGQGSEQIFDEDISLSPGEYRAVEFDIEAERSVSFGFSGDDDATLDILFLPHEEFAAYERGDDFEYRYTSGLDVSDGYAEDENVPAGRYVVVFDNTDRGEATPSRQIDGRAEVSLEASN
ncbi:hypothetical protein HWV07_16965 [Natronomonas salina]|uniref:hypothetical protein n=1 Tax=Natronomonas salina TaxID=1710540 RepID=UPI0015B4B4F4|nr:hypothetical protein [Natronomonas salina]QLD90638.1 hypothetical protein HWV07_16965 [Natronomonas salina]